MADEPLPDYLDRMIFSLYGATQRGIGYVEKNPTHTEVIEHIEDEKTGRPVPIDDSADHFLLRNFDRVRQHLQSLPPPRGNGICGSVRVIGEVGTWWNTNEVYGEIPWRNKHTELCRTCGRPTDEDSLICSAGHLDIRTRMTADRPGKVREISRAIPLRKEDEE